MLALFIDTSTQTKIFALLHENQVISRYCYPAISKAINEPLFAWIRESTQKYGFAVTDVTCIAVGYGPGPSFTGIRMGVSVASSLAYAFSIPMVGLCSLELYKPTMDSNTFWNISDARGGELYYVKGEANLNTYQFTTPKVMNIHGWRDKIAPKNIQIISVQHEFFRGIIGKNVIPAVINWEYIIKKIFQINPCSDPLLFTIPYCKNPR